MANENLPESEKTASGNPVSSDGQGPVKKSRWGKVVRRGLASFFLFLAIATVIGYHVAMNSDLIKNAIVNGFAKASYGSISLDIKQMSLFRGFIFENIKITSSPEFDNRALLEMKKLSILYNVYGFFSGEFGIHEIGIYQPRFQLIQKNNRWNFATLMKPSEAKEKKEKEEEKEKEDKDPGEPRDKVSLPFSLRIFFKFVLEDFALVVDGGNPSNRNPITAEIKNFTFRTHILTTKFDTIPLGVSAVKLIDTFLIQLNPQQKFDISLKSKDLATTMSFNTHWLLAFDGNQKETRFFSKMLVGNEEIPLHFKGQKRLPLNFLIDYDLHLNPITDVLKLEHFYIQFMGDRMLNLSGQVTNVSKKDKMHIDFKLDKSLINLNKILQVYRSFLGDYSKSFGGTITLAPLYIKGGLNNLAINGSLALAGINFYQPGVSVNLPYFNLNYDVLVNLSKKALAPVDYAKVKWRGNLNGSALIADIHYVPDQKVDVGIYVNNFNPKYFTPMADGLFNVAISAVGKNETSIAAKVKLFSEKFNYILDRGRSGDNNFDLTLEANVRATSTEFKNLDISVPKINLELKNYEGIKAFWLYSNANVKMAPGKMNVLYTLSQLGVNFPHLHPTLTGKLRESTDALKKDFQKNIEIDGRTIITIAGTNIDVDHNTNIKVKDLNIEDLSLNALVAVKPKIIKIPAISLTGLNKALNLKVDGKLEEGYHEAFDKKDPDKIVRRKDMVPYFNVDFYFGKIAKEKIFQQHAIQGAINLKVKLNDNIAEGNMSIKDFNYDNNAGTLVNKVNMDFDFRHNLLFAKPLNLTAANKERIIKNYNYSKPFNFTIDSVIIPHPINKTPFALISSNTQYKGFGAYLSYKDNVFQMPAMQIFMLNGSITAQDILFNLGRGRVKEMQYAAQIQVKDIDLKPLIPPEKAKTIEDGSMRIDIGILGDRLDQPIENIKGYVSVYKIGEEFGKSGLKVVMPDSNFLIDWSVQQTIIVQKINLEISEGLVYAQVIFSKGVIAGGIIGPSGNQILQNRIPISQFLQRAQTETKKYQVAK